uniref:C2H2-type domain-containing protein n=1 Tax=Glossina brevipalpis TaxID=37001 RepID=A0A1A9WWU5_9MUSC
MTTSSAGAIDMTDANTSASNCSPLKDVVEPHNNFNNVDASIDDKETRIKIIHQNTEITNLPNCRPQSQSLPTISSGRRFIMVDQKLRLPTELRKSLKFIGKDERGYYKYLAPLNTLSDATVRFETAYSQTEILAASLEESPRITLKKHVINKTVPPVSNDDTSSVRLNLLQNNSSTFPNPGGKASFQLPTNVQLLRLQDKERSISTSSLAINQRSKSSQNLFASPTHNNKRNDIHLKTHPKLKNLKVLLRRLPMISQPTNEMNGQSKKTSTVANNLVELARRPGPGSSPSKSLQPIDPISIKTPTVLIVQQPLEKFNPLDLQTSEKAEKFYENNSSKKTTRSFQQRSSEILAEGKKCNEVQTDLSFEGVCGLVDTNHFHLNCFYCSNFYPLECWSEFLQHVKFQHNIEEKVFSHLDHDYAMLNEKDIKKDDLSDYDEIELNELYNRNLPSPMHVEYLHDERNVNELSPNTDFTKSPKVNIISDLAKPSKALIKADNLDYFFQTCKNNVTKSNVLSEANETIDEDYPIGDFYISNNSSSPFTGTVDFDNDENENNFNQPMKALLIKDSLNFATSFGKSSDDDGQRSECDKEDATTEQMFSEDDSFGDELFDIEEDREFLEIPEEKMNDFQASQDTYELSDEGLDSREEYEIDQSEGIGGCDSVSSTLNDIEISDDEMPSNDENEDDVPKPSRGCGILFGLTNRSVVIEFLENLKKYPVLYSNRSTCTRNEYDETIMKMCSILNKKYHLDITDFEMRRSIQRVNDWFSRTAYKMRKHERNIPYEPFKHRFPTYFKMCEKFLERTRLPYNLDLIKNSQDAAVFKRFNQNSNYPPWVKYTVTELKKRNCQIYNQNSSQSQSDVKTLIHAEASSKNITKTTQNSIVVRKAITLHQKAPKQPEQGEYKCDQCGREYTLWRKFRAHKYTHLPPKFKCEICEKMFTRNYFLQKHIEAVHCSPSLNTEVKPKLINEREEYKCDECGKILYRKNAFRQHKLRHQPPQYQCKKCEKMFYSKAALDNHNHSSRCQPAPYICEYCGKAIYSRSTFRIHKKTKHFNIRRWYTCVVCNHKSQYQRYLLRHQQRHHLAEEGTLEDLARRTNPQGMRLVHFSEEYRKGYLWRNSLRRPGEKVYSCLTCHVVFERYKDVLHHNKEKHPIRHGTYKCQLCPPPGRLLMRSSLRRHYTSMHKVPPEELEVWVSRTKPVLPPTTDGNESKPNECYATPITDNDNEERNHQEESNGIVLIEQIEEDNDTVNSLENDINEVSMEEADFDDLVVEIIESEDDN